MLLAVSCVLYAVRWLLCVAFVCIDWCLMRVGCLMSCVVCRLLPVDVVWCLLLPDVVCCCLMVIAV